MLARITSCLAVFAALTTTLTAVAHAQFITDQTELGDSPTVVSFSQFTARSTVFPQMIDAGGISVSLTNTTPSGVSASPAIYNDRFGIGGYFSQFPELSSPAFCMNGEWSSARQGFVGLFPGTSVRFGFGGTLVSSVGAFMNYTPVCGGYSSPRIRLLGADNAVLAEYDIDVLARITTPNQLNAGAFRGARREQGDIAGVEFVGGVLVLDEFSFAASAPTTPVPEPQSAALVGAGIAGLVIGGVRRRRIESRRRAVEGGFVS